MAAISDSKRIKEKMQAKFYRFVCRPRIPPAGQDSRRPSLPERTIAVEFPGVLTRFVIYGLLGWCFEVVWSATTEKAWGKQRDWRLVGHTYLWMFPIYGLLAPLGEPVHNLLRTKVWVVRGIAYLIGIWLVEFATGWLLRRLTGKCPWDYSAFRGNIQGIVTLEYAPVWFIFGLAFERVHDTLVVLTPGIRHAIGL